MYMRCSLVIIDLNSADLNSDDLNSGHDNVHGGAESCPARSGWNDVLVGSKSSPKGTSAIPILVVRESATVDSGPSGVNRSATPSCLPTRLRHDPTAIMDAHNLKTASAYINNLLLARGLLRDGKAIEFAHPSRGEGGKEQTMAHIINLVHDLILKRDVGTGEAWN